MRVETKTSVRLSRRDFVGYARDAYPTQTGNADGTCGLLSRVKCMNHVWDLGDIYECGNPECRSKVLVVQSSRAAQSSLWTPQCICGSVLEYRGPVASTFVMPEPAHASALVGQIELEEVRE